ncbi:MAG: cytidine deaminase [Clostridiales bacterium]|nr:MAG: cytidine deaminase [Clostridiales bacterium]
MRKDKINYYLDMADAATGRGTCLRRNFGAIIVQNDEVVATGYSGAPRGRENCCDLGKCVRQELGLQRGERYELCRSVHAEANCIISAARRDMIGATLYLVGHEVKSGNYVENAAPCAMCKRMIINAGIKNVIVRDTKEDYHILEVDQWIQEDESLHGTIGY